MLKKVILQNSITNEKREFENELEYKKFIISDNDNEWEIVDLQLVQKQKAQKNKQVRQWRAVHCIIVIL